MQPNSRRRLTSLAGLAVGAAAAWLAFRDLRLAELGAVLVAIGPAAALAFVPQTVSMAIDTAAWQRVLRRLGDEVAYVLLARARVASEFIALALPGGAIMADGTLSLILTRSCGVRSPDAVAAVAARKLMIWRAHAAALFLAAAGVVAQPGALGAQRPQLVAVLLVAAGAVAAIAVLLAVLAGSASPAQRLRGLMLRLPFRRLRAALEEAEAHFRATDVRLAVAARTRAVRAHLLYVLAWLVRAAEPWVILRLAGARLSYVEVLAAEAVVGVVRSAAVVVPAGLGVQELGYAMFLRLTGAPDPAALTAALALLRRAREAFWAALGYALLWRGRGAAALGSPAAAAEPVTPSSNA